MSQSEGVLSHQHLLLLHQGAASLAAIRAPDLGRTQEPDLYRDQSAHRPAEETLGAGKGGRHHHRLMVMVMVHAEVVERAVTSVG